MSDVLLIFHFVGLMLGAGGGLGSTVAMGYANSLSEQKAKTVRGLGPILARMSLAGVVIMWLTGIWLLLTRYDITALPVMFWFKIGFVLLLTVAAVSIEMTYARVKAGNAKAAALLPSLGPMAGISSLMAVIFAVLAFH
jgi:uncharacterized protein with PQ loop repeat